MLKKAEPDKPYAMHTETSGKNLSALLDLYNKEIDTLKSKLLNGIPWEDLVAVRRNITELAIAIQKLHNYHVPDQLILMYQSLYYKDQVRQTNFCRWFRCAWHMVYPVRLF